jgi:hypothetical protein
MCVCLPLYVYLMCCEGTAPQGGGRCEGLF